MIVDKATIRAVLKGGPTKLPQPAKVEVGTVHALQTRVGKKASCTVKILEVHPDWCLVEFATRPVQPLYLAHNGGYTEDPNYAVQSEVGVAEWAPPKDWVDPGLEARQTHHRALQSDELERRMAEAQDWDRLVYLKMLARERGVDVRSDLRTIERRLDAIEDKIRQGRQAA